MERFKALAASLVVVAMFAFLAMPSTSNAVTAAELQAQITALQAQLALLVGGSSGVSCTFTRNLFLGVSGADVQCLQRYLNSAGFTVAASGAGSVGFETMFYGPLTMAAVARWQAANNVSPAVGYFGPISTAKYNALIVANPPADDDDDDADDGTCSIDGGAGSISGATFLAGLNNEEVGEDEEDAEVAGLEIEADDGSDIELTAVTLDFSDNGAANNDDDLDEYASEVSIWLDGEEVARIDADEFDDDNAYTRTVSLDGCAKIDAGDTGELVVAVSGIANLDAASAGDTWDVEFETVRFRDGQDAVISDSATGDINGVTRIFSFESFATASNVELVVSPGDEEINDAHVIDIHATADTDNVPVLSFEVEVEGDSDLAVDDIVVEFTVVGVANLDDMVSGIALLMDGDEVGSESPLAADETVTFDDIDLTLEAGETYEFTVQVDFLSIADGIVEADTIAAVVTDTETDLWDVEDDSGEDLIDADKTGAASGETHALYDNAFNVELVSTDADVVAGELAGESDRGVFTITWDITSFGADIFIGTSSDEDDDDAEDGAGYSVNAVVTGTSTATFTCSGCDTDATSGAFMVDEGTTERFTLTVNQFASSDTFFEVQLETIGWSAGADDTADANIFTFGLEDFDAGPIFLTAR